jgi:hypothetical protein
MLILFDMENKLFCVFSIILLFISGDIFTDEDEFHLNDIDTKFIGIYLPVNYISSLNTTLNHYISLRLNKNRYYHDILIVHKNKIYSNLEFNDGYAIRSKEAINYKFLDNENDIKIMDSNNYEYIKISNEINDYGIIFSNYIGRIIFAKVIFDNRIQFNGDRFSVNNQNIEFGINLYNFESTPNLVLVSINEVLFLEIINNRYIIYKTRRVNAIEREKTGEIYFEF